MRISHLEEWLSLLKLSSPRQSPRPNSPRPRSALDCWAVTSRTCPYLGAGLKPLPFQRPFLSNICLGFMVTSSPLRRPILARCAPSLLLWLLHYPKLRVLSLPKNLLSPPPTLNAPSIYSHPHHV